MENVICSEVYMCGLIKNPVDTVNKSYNELLILP